MVRKTRFAGVLGFILCAALLSGLVPAFAQGASLEPVNITIAWNEQWADTSNNPYWPNQVAQYVAERTGVRIDIMGMDDEKLKVLIAGRDLPDMVFMAASTHISQLIEGNSVIPLDDLLETNGPDIQKNASDMLALLRKYSDYGTGKLYVLSNETGPALPPAGASSTGYQLRWDLYKELGCPEFKTNEELVAILKQMHDLYPETDEGKPVYAVGTQNEWHNQGLWGYKVNGFSEGWWETNTPGYSYAMGGDREIINNYTNLDGPFWRRINFMYLCDKEGLLDPDTFTMTVGDYDAKMKAGQYLYDMIAFWTPGFYREEALRDPGSIRGFQMIPFEGGSVWDNAMYYSGFGKLWTITTNAKAPERCMDLLNYLFTPEFARVRYCGFQGVQWDVIDGVPQMLPLAWDQRLDTDLWNKEIGLDSTWQFSGLNTGFIGPDGYPSSLWANITPHNDAKANEMLTACDRDYMAYYGLTKKYDIVEKAIADGKMIDASQTIILPLPSPPDDIMFIDSNLDIIAVKAIPKLVKAKDNAEYQEVQAKMLDDMKAAGIEDSEKWWFDTYYQLLQGYKDALGL